MIDILWMKSGVIPPTNRHEVNTNQWIQGGKPAERRPICDSQ